MLQNEYDCQERLPRTIFLSTSPIAVAICQRCIYDQLTKQLVGKQVSKYPCAPLTNCYRDRGSGRCIFLYIHIQAYASRCHEPLSNRFKHAMQTTGLTFVEIFILVSKLSVALRFQTCHIENVLSWFSMFIDNGVAATTHAYGESYEGWLQRHIATQGERCELCLLCCCCCCCLLSCWCCCCCCCCFFVHSLCTSCSLSRKMLETTRPPPRLVVQFPCVFCLLNFNMF